MGQRVPAQLLEWTGAGLGQLHRARRFKMSLPARPYSINCFRYSVLLLTMFPTLTAQRTPFCLRCWCLDSFLPTSLLVNRQW